MSHALILQHGDSAPPGLLADWAAAQGIEVRVHRPDLGEPLPAANGQLFIASLGSRHNPTETGVPEIAAERALIGEAVDRDIPVLGLCFGAQMLASVLGASVQAAPVPECGWHSVRSTAPELIAEGPWLQWHFDAFTLPPGAEQHAGSPAGVQAFTHGRHLGVQFHPEATIEIVKGWARHSGDRLAAMGIADGEALVESGRAHAPNAGRAAFALFDAFWRRARQ